MILTRESQRREIVSTSLSISGTGYMFLSLPSDHLIASGALCQVHSLICSLNEFMDRDHSIGGQVARYANADGYAQGANISLDGCVFQLQLQTLPP